LNPKISEISGEKGIEAEIFFSLVRGKIRGIKRSGGGVAEVREWDRRKGGRWFVFIFERQNSYPGESTYRR
jgi:hypothetical protein